MSHIFADSPIREPPTGRRRDILNQKYDHILVCLDAILNRAERGLEEVRIAVTEAREAVEQRRHPFCEITWTRTTWTSTSSTTKETIA